MPITPRKVVIEKEEQIPKIWLPGLGWVPAQNFVPETEEEQEDLDRRLQENARFRTKYKINTEAI